MTSLYVGCPVQSRSWVLPLWFHHIEMAAAEACLLPHYVFVGDPTTDRATFDTIDKECLFRGRSRDIVEVPERKRNDFREWGPERYKHMAWLRNQMLRHIRTVNPDLFWSVDSDILVHPHSLAHAIEMLDTGFGAIGSRCYMSPHGIGAPSYATLGGTGGLRRKDSEGQFPVEVIMAVKLMGPSAYAVDYEPSSMGEDIGWSQAARKAGVRLGWDGSVVSKHVMAPEYLDVIDDRCGF